MIVATACGAAEQDVSASSDAPRMPAPAAQPTAVAFSGRTGFEIGDRVPEFEVSLTDGTPITSAQLQAQGRPTFLFFFSMT